MAFQQVGPFRLPQLEATAIDRWQRLEVASRVAEHRKNGDDWIFYEGPPTANGKPGLHHGPDLAARPAELVGTSPAR